MRKLVLDPELGVMVAVEGQAPAEAPQPAQAPPEQAEQDILQDLQAIDRLGRPMDDD